MDWGFDLHWTMSRLHISFMDSLSRGLPTYVLVLTDARLLLQQLVSYLSSSLSMFTCLHVIFGTRFLCT